MSIITRKFKLGLLATALAMTAVVSVSYAFAASNTVDVSKAGQGTGAATGYTVTAVGYTLNAVDPTIIDSVYATLNTTPSVGSTAKVQLDSTGGTWFTCTWIATALTCDTTGTPPNVVDVDGFNIVIADKP